MRAQLVPLEGGDPVEIVKDMTLVGRKEDCDFRLDHKSVSKVHCVIVKTDGLLLIRDLGSTNGTRVNDQRVRRAALLPNDQLTIARFKYRVEFGGEEVSLVPDDHTQQLEAGEVVELMKKRKSAEAEASPQPSKAPLWPNPLPDLIPDKDSHDPEE